VTDLDARPPVGVDVLERSAVRALVVDASDRLLLFVGVDPHAPERGRWWFTPGGGLEPGETERAALVREVCEETGLILDPRSLGRPVWRRQAHFLFAGQWYHQSESFYLIRIEAHDVDTSGFQPLEASSVLDHRWWSVAELDASDEPRYPRELAGELRRLLELGPPDAPYEVA
jgi:8-oxo-dGTP pyrophosphatase MutT (NUDIX family)